jgi:glucose/arabinose dehydrogenase
VHDFASVPAARQIRFAPGGELFVASPSTPTIGGASNGLSAIALVADDDRDGTGDAVVPFLGGLPSTQGLLFAPGFLYYQDDTRVMRIPYAAGDRTPPASLPQQVIDVQVYRSDRHWPKTLDIADDGTIYVSNGGDQGEACDPSRPFHGGILAIDGSPGGAPVARGLRNPIAVRCAPGTSTCWGLELSRDGTDGEGGREKLFPIRPGDDWGYPCCATKDLPFPDLVPQPDCSRVAGETGSFVVGQTPFGLDFEPRRWPAPWRGRVFVTLHGEFGTWQGEGLVALATDAASGVPVDVSDLTPDAGGASDSGLMVFAAGWDDGTHAHGRPAAVAFAPDGRLFVANDNSGEIVWIAPVGLTIPR